MAIGHSLINVIASMDTFSRIPEKTMFLQLLISFEICMGKKKNTLT